jgi:hypothetical protein
MNPGGIAPCPVAARENRYGAHERLRLVLRPSAICIPPARGGEEATSVGSFAWAWRPPRSCGARTSGARFVPQRAPLVAITAPRPRVAGPSGSAGRTCWGGRDVRQRRVRRETRRAFSMCGQVGFGRRVRAPLVEPDSHAQRRRTAFDGARLPDAVELAGAGSPAWTDM